MHGQFILLTERLHDYLFQRDTATGMYRIKRPQLDLMIEWFGEELTRMREVDDG